MSANIAQYQETKKIIIKKGDTLSLSLNYATKLQKKDIYNILKKQKTMIDVDHCFPGDFYEIIYNKKTGKLINFKYYSTKNSCSFKIKSPYNNNIKKTLKRNKNSFNKKQGIVSSSLWSSMRAKNIPKDIIHSFMDIFSGQINFADAKQGDSFNVLYETECINKKNRRLSENVIAAAQYKTHLKTYNAFHFKTKKNQGYYDENGKSLKGAFLKAPLQFKRISSFFSTNRFHPILKYTRPHLGIDYAAPSGTPVLAIANGTVVMAKYNGGFGNLVIIKHPNGYETYYGHLSQYGKHIKKGTKVNQGQIVGYVGMTGLATGPHLDFRVKFKNKFINFLNMKQLPSTTLTGKEKRLFNEKSKILLKKLKRKD
ncbi:MAG: M23 family metallopeptidase [Endomicrobium sp.]|nr:M23 family metallopeptidase [Endomicrobium sp.]